MSTRIVYMGTPDFAVPALAALIAPPAREKGYEVVAVVTQPDRPSGRGKKMSPSPVKVKAERARIRVLQPENLTSEQAVGELMSLQPDIIIVAAFGQILRQNVLMLPPYGCLNIHASLLPRWRGAAPVAAAILAGDRETGITIMRMNQGLDTGPITAQRGVLIRLDHTAGTLTTELAEVGAALLLDTLPGWLAGEIEALPQDDSLATLAPRLKKEDGHLNWAQPAVEIERRVRAFDPWPGTYTEGPNGRFKVLSAALAPHTSAPPAGHSPAGTVFEHQRRVYVTTGQGVLELVTVQPAGKKAMSATAMLNGQPEMVGSRLT